MNKQLHQQLFQANARIESMIHLGGMITDGDSLPEAIDDLLYEGPETLADVFPDVPASIKEVLNVRDEIHSAFCEWIHQKQRLGFVVQFATPVMSHVDEDGGGTYSWGHYYTHWAYGETLEEAAGKGLAWVAERRASEREKQSVKAGQAGKALPEGRSQ